MVSWLCRLATGPAGWWAYQWTGKLNMAAEEQLNGSLKYLRDLRAALDEYATVAITAPRGKITQPDPGNSSKSSGRALAGLPGFRFQRSMFGRQPKEEL